MKLAILLVAIDWAAVWDEPARSAPPPPRPTPGTITPKEPPVADFHASLDQSLVRVFHTPAQSAPEWRTSDKDPRIEVYGREVDGVFRYTHWRFKARPTAAAVQPAARACKNGRCPR